MYRVHGDSVISAKIVCIFISTMEPFVKLTLTSKHLPIINELCLLHGLM